MPSIKEFRNVELNLSNNQNIRKILKFFYDLQKLL